MSDAKQSGPDPVKKQGVGTFLANFLTDAKNRPAIELLLGTVLLIPTSVYAFGGFGAHDSGTLLSMLGFIGALFGLNTVGNIFDKSGGN